MRLPKIGDRVRFKRDVDRFPDFVAPAGSTGTVTEVRSDTLFVKMDAAIPGCEPWDNTVHFYDATSYGDANGDGWDNFDNTVEYLT